MNALKIRVRGRVQGVGYRRFAQRRADECGIKGWARNLYNGEVEIYASGEDESLRTYLKYLKEGPAMGQVDEIQTQDVATESYNDFSILPDGAP